MSDDFKGQSIWNQDWYKVPKESLRDEVEDMFRDEARKARRNADKTWNMPPGYYDNISYRSPGFGERARMEFEMELLEIKRLKDDRGKK